RAGGYPPYCTGGRARRTRKLPLRFSCRDDIVEVGEFGGEILGVLIDLSSWQTERMQQAIQTRRPYCAPKPGTVHIGQGVGEHHRSDQWVGGLGGVVRGNDLQNRRGKMPVFPEPLSRHRMRYREGVELDFGHINLGG